MSRFRIALALCAVAGITLATPQIAVAQPPPPTDDPASVARADDSKVKPTDRLSRFSRLFPELPPFNAPTPQQIADLAQTQLDPNADSENNPEMLSVFTYFGQFVDHDLTLDLSPSPTETTDPTTLFNSRTFRFDLDSVYGGGPTKSPQLYAADQRHFLVQNPNPNGVPDLPRNPDGSAILIEARNDENQILSQIHASFLLLHNRLVDRGLSFEQAQRRTILLYQTIVAKEVLPHFVGQATADKALTRGALPNFFRPGNPNRPNTPVEFSVASYRFGHSMVRRAYRLQPGPDGAAGANVQVFSLTAPDLRGGRQLTADRIIDWGNFVPELTRPENTLSVNVSRKIDPLISSSLFVLPIPGAAASGSNVLAFRNMVRAKFYDMPSGEDVARRMGIPVIETGLAAPFDQHTPLWFYILAESAQSANGVTLGPVGGQITAEVFADILRRDRDSILRGERRFVPNGPEAGPAGRFILADLFVASGLAVRP